MEVKFFAKPKVCYFEVSQTILCGQQNVVRLDVSVDDANWVDVADPSEYGPHNSSSLVVAELPSALPSLPNQLF